MEAIQQLFGNQITGQAKSKFEKERTGYSKDLGWVFVCREFQSPKSVRSYKSFFALNGEMIYFTPNTFYRNDRREEETLRWLNALVIDIDVKNGENQGITIHDVLDRINLSGLPMPTLIVQTPTGGFHIYFYLQEPMRATPKAIKLYKTIQREIALQIGGDLQAIGAERWFRIPTEKNTLVFTGERVAASFFVDWLELYKEVSVTAEKGSKCVYVTKGGLLSHPAINKLFKGAEEGQRDNTAYTLALTFMAEGYSQEEAESHLYEWNSRLDSPLQQLEIKRKVKSAYHGKAKGPSAYWISTLSGISFSYRPMVGKRDRRDRKYSHYEEWEKDLLQILKREGSLCGGQRKLAELTGIPYTSFKVILERLFKAGEIIVKVEGKGRAAKTIIEIVRDRKIVKLPKKPKKTLLKNEPNSNTFMDRWVGGWSSRFLNAGSLVLFQARSFKDPPD